jgi:hypothetical protein
VSAGFAFGLLALDVCTLGLNMSMFPVGQKGMRERKVPTNGSSASTAQHRLPYSAPTMTKLTREAAEAILRAKTIPGDPRTEELLKKMRLMGEQTTAESDQRSGETTAQLRLPGRWRVAFAAAMLLLIAAPIFIFITAIGPNADRAAEYTPICFPIWAAFAVWVTLDAPALLRLIGPRPDPLGSRSLQVSALGIANLAAMFLFLILTKGK